MQKTAKAALGAGVLVALLALGAGIALADGGTQKGKGGGQGNMAGPMGMMSPAIDFAAADANKDGKVTAAEFTAWRAAVVKTIDANGDGKLSVEEITAFELAMAKWRLETRIQVMMARSGADANGDGALTSDEIGALHAIKAKAADANGDGKITVEEVTTYELARIQPRITDRTNAMVASLDADGDKQLSAAELLARPMAVPGFKQLDRNKDGVLVLDELAPPGPMPGMPGGGPDDGLDGAPPPAGN
jgi:Ca2+-binding EF-hand superfamily protein